MINRLLPVAILLIAIGIFFGYISPEYTGTILPKLTEIKRYDKALLAADNFTKKQAQIAAEKAAIPAESLARLETYLPDGVDNVQAILDLNALAARSGVQLSNFNIRDNSSAEVLQDGSLPATGGATDSIDLSVKATGTYAAFRTFLVGVERSLRPMDITQMTVNDSQTGVYTYAITIRMYWLH